MNPSPDLCNRAGSTAKFAFLSNGVGKVFRQVDGTIAAISVKSKIRTNDVESILDDFARIPQMSTASEQVNPNIKNRDLTEFLLCIVYASACDDLNRIATRVRNFYQGHSSVPNNRRPSIIHVNGEGVIFRAEKGAAHGNTPLKENEFYVLRTTANVFGLSQVKSDIQRRVAIVPHIIFRSTPSIPGVLLERLQVPYEIYGPQE